MMKRFVDKLISRLEQLPRKRDMSDYAETGKVHDYVDIDDVRGIGNQLAEEYQKENDDTDYANIELYNFWQKHQWIPCSERLPEESNHYCVTTENIETGDRIEQTIWFAHKDDYDMEESEWRELCDYERVVAWKPSNPYRESEV